MADIKITSQKQGKREVLVNGISVPDVVDVSLYVRPGSVDEAVLTIHVDKFQSAE